MPANQKRTESPLMNSVEKLKSELDHWMENALSQGGRALEAFGFRGSSGSWTPVVDVVETGDEVLVDVDLPGIDPAAVEVSLAGNMLTLKGSKSVRPTLETDAEHHRERSHGKFLRSLPLPVPVDAENVSAEFRHGVLHVRLAKAERAKVREIRVKVSSTPIGSTADFAPTPPAM
jgi:HSP20 family protein